MPSPSDASSDGGADAFALRPSQELPHNCTRFTYNVRHFLLISSFFFSSS